MRGERFGKVIFLVSFSLSLDVPILRGDENSGASAAAVKESKQLILKDAPAGKQFAFDELSLSCGHSDHFRVPPHFCLFSDRGHNPGEGIGYPSTEVLEELELPNAQRYPIQLRDLTSPSISGFTVIGVQSRDLPWRVMKAMWDGDALHVKGCRGRVEVADVYWENVEDGFGPMEGLEYWSLRNAYMRYIRDDAVENDDLVSGEIVNCLIDGCFTFLSQRPGSFRPSDAVTVIRDCVVHVEAQPHDGIPGKAWRDRNIRIGPDGMGRAPGMLFKWAPGAGSVVVRNCIFRIDAVSVNGPDDLKFPPGEYENVTLIWLGEGEFPRPLPSGVKIIRDVEVWNQARRDWFDRAGPSHPATAALKEIRKGPSGAEQPFREE